jgi:defect-in-organelle-trafficking protein DotB
MTETGGSDLFLMGGSDIWMSIYGKKARLSKRRISDSDAFKLIQHIYGDNAKTKLGASSPINCSYEFKKEAEDSTEDRKKTERHRFRVNAVGCLRSGRRSLTITLRTIPTTPPSVADMGVEKEIIDVCRQSDQGLILVAGATGNGKSTLLASILRDQLEDPEGHRNLVTVEEPIEFVYDEVEKPNSILTQIEIGQGVNSFAEGVRNSLRMAPTTILIGESRDLETIKASVDASITGHVVFSTLHANSAPESLQRLISQFDEDSQEQAKMDILQALKMIIAQRLVPTVDGKRTAIREYLIFDQGMKDKLAVSKNMNSLLFEMMEEHGKPMIKDVEQKFADGVISQEVFDRQRFNYEREKEAGGVG